MTSNPLRVVQPQQRGILSAAEFAAIAREDGKLELAKAWDKRADELGEPKIPYGLTVKFVNGVPTRVPLR